MRKWRNNREKIFYRCRIRSSVYIYTRSITAKMQARARADCVYLYRLPAGDANVVTAINNALRARNSRVSRSGYNARFARCFAHADNLATGQANSPLRCVIRGADCLVNKSCPVWRGWKSVNADKQSTYARLDVYNDEGNRFWRLTLTSCFF